MTLAVVNIGDSHVGDLLGTPLDGDTILCEDGLISWVGSRADADLDG